MDTYWVNPLLDSNLNSIIQLNTVSVVIWSSEYRMHTLELCPYSEHAGASQK